MGVAASLPDPATHHLPAELVERVLRFLSVRDRARCELVCRGWLATSRSSALLWRTVEWDERRNQVLELQWLGGRGPVQRLWLPPDWSRVLSSLPPCAAFPAAASTLASWAPRLQRLSLHFSITPRGFLVLMGSLRQLTWLQLSGVLTEPARVALGSLGILPRLRTLCYRVSYNAGTDRDRELPLLPASVEHLRLSTWATLGQLRGLQSLVYCVPAHPPVLLGLGSLTALVLHDKCSRLPPGLSTLTSLRYLRAASFYLDLEPPDGAAPLHELCHLPKLEWLYLRSAWTATLPLFLPASLRVLDLASTPGAIPPGTRWLATLQQLGCTLDQLPAPEELAAAARLCKLALFIPKSDLPSQQVECAVASLAGLPALETFCCYYCHDGGEREERKRRWGPEVEAALALLRQAKPGLSVVGHRCCFPLSPGFSQGCLEWPSVGGLAEFSDAAD